jgi:hypothetical protein
MEYITELGNGWIEVTAEKDLASNYSRTECFKVELLSSFRLYHENISDINQDVWNVGVYSHNGIGRCYGEMSRQKAEQLYAELKSVIKKAE